MLEAASFSLRALLVFRPLVRGGDGTLSSGSEVSTETETSRSALAEGSGTEAFAAIVAESGGLSSAGGSSLIVVASGSWASSSFNASKLFLVSRVASAVWVAFGAWANGSFRLGYLHRVSYWLKIIFFDWSQLLRDFGTTFCKVTVSMAPEALKKNLLVVQLLDMAPSP